jgi:hypothetical protein
MRCILGVWITDIKYARQKTTAFQEVTETNPGKFEPNAREKEAVMVRQKIPNKEVAVHSPRACRSERAASQGATEADAENIESDPGMMQSVPKHQEAPKENAVVKPLKGRNKRNKARKPVTGGRGEPKELTRRDCGSGKKLAAACRKVSSCATVAWRKRNLLRKIRIQASCNSRRRLAVGGRRMSRRATVVRSKRYFQKNSDIGKLWTAQRIFRRRSMDDPLCKRSTRQGTRIEEVRKRRHST